jgi:hypothetical protein
MWRCGDVRVWVRVGEGTVVFVCVGGGVAEENRLIGRT